jgi:hypothetical protein
VLLLPRVPGPVQGATCHEQHLRANSRSWQGPCHPRLQGSCLHLWVPLCVTQGRARVCVVVVVCCVVMVVWFLGDPGVQPRDRQGTSNLWHLLALLSGMWHLRPPCSAGWLVDLQHNPVAGDGPCAVVQAVYVRSYPVRAWWCSVLRVSARGGGPSISVSKD